MANITQAEKDYLQMVLANIDSKIEKAESDNKYLIERMKETQHYMWESIYEMDNAEKAFAQSQMEMLDNETKEKINQIVALRASRKSPYFGSIDFDLNNEKLSYRIGLTGIKDGNKIYVVDWRAPFSELYYNFDVGPGYYYVGEGNEKVTGNITSKKQYKIEDGKLIFCLESNMKIDDSILQEVLAKTSSDKMKNIVSTIQREQNQIIRNDSPNNMIVQGVAGSGKTSIALHRIAYLLYKHRGTLNSNSILIISPNKFFSDYISNVLPELGEENIAETVMDELITMNLGIKEKIESKSEQVERLLNNNLEIQNASLKGSMQFCRDIIAYCKNYFNENFKATDFVFDDFLVVKKEKLEQLYFELYKDKPVAIKMEWIKDFVVDSAEPELKLTSAKARRILDGMLKVPNIFEIYNDFLNKTYGLNFKRTKKIKFEDAVPLLYIKQQLFGTNKYNKIKHLVIDEFQDYSPLNYYIINQMFPCIKTILGDIGQNVAGYESTILDEFNELDTIKNQMVSLNKSYRSTYEITTFANNIINRTNVQIVDRHGEEVAWTQYKTQQDKINKIIEFVEESKKQNNKTIGILCKSIQKCEELHELIKDKIKYHHLTIDTLDYKDGVILAPTFLVKGLEFDAVIVVDVDNQNYCTQIDKQALYVASTRAMHKLALLYNGKKPFQL
ncbi:MAG: hypothetical protein E7378_00315 [Clostridiales bacterium]|nr:hypothetical protein [Clostridiales bacterium]